MPLVGFTCPPSAPTYGDAETFDHCITKCKDRCMSPYMLAAMAASNQRNHHKGKYISATSLAGCVRKLVNERTYDYTQEVSKVFYGFRGTLTHAVVEEAALWKGFGEKNLLELGFLSEWNMKLGFCFEHGGFEIPATLDATDDKTWGDTKCPHCDGDWFVLGGTLDGAEPIRYDKATKTIYMTLHDLKTMQEYAVDKFVHGDDGATLHTHIKDAYYLQAQIYRYLAERSTPPEFFRTKGIEHIKFLEARLQAFAMGKAPYMGTSFWSRKHWKHPYEAFPIPTIGFESDEWVEKYITEKGRPIYDSLLMGNVRAPICEPEGKGEHSWACDFCAFFKTEYCPDPAVEWRALKGGATPEEAFAKASGRTLPVLP